MSMTINRRMFLSGLAATMAAPYVIRQSGLLMPVKQVLTPNYVWIEEGSNDMENWQAVGRIKAMGHGQPIGSARLLFSKPQPYYRVVLETEWQRREASLAA